MAKKRNTTHHRTGALTSGAVLCQSQKTTFCWDLTLLPDI